MHQCGQGLARILPLISIMQNGDATLLCAGNSSKPSNSNSIPFLLPAFSTASVTYCWKGLCSMGSKSSVLLAFWMSESRRGTCSMNTQWVLLEKFTLSSPPTHLPWKHGLPWSGCSLHYNALQPIANFQTSYVTDCIGVLFSLTFSMWPRTNCLVTSSSVPSMQRTCTNSFMTTRGHLRCIPSCSLYSTSLLWRGFPLVAGPPWL